MDGKRLSVVLLVVFAGCGSLTGGPDPAPSPTLTPAAVPEATTEAPSPLPPGVTGNGVADPDRLTAAHAAALAGRSFTLRVTVTRDNRTTCRMIRVADDRRYSYRKTADAGPATVIEYGSGRFRYRRTVDPPHGLLFDRSRGANAHTRYGWLLQLPVRSIAAIEDATVSEARVDGDRSYVLRAAEDRHPQLEERRNVSVRATIRPDGLVTSVDVSYVLRAGSNETVITRSTEVSGLGTTTVDAPDWVIRRWNVSGDPRTSETP